MDFTVLEARKFISSGGSRTSRAVKDYEIDMECGSDRIYTYDPIRECRLSYGDILVRKPKSVVASVGAQNSYILTLDFSGSTPHGTYSRNIPGTFQPMVENELISRLEPIIHPTHISEIMRIYQKLICLPNHNSDIAKELVCELIYTLNAEISRKNYEILKPTGTVADTIIAYMQEHLERRITLNDLSKLVCLEKSYLLRLFRRETGQTPIEMLITMRLDKASDLIAVTDLSVSEIAAECGYHTVSFFISAYKKRYDITPEAHRRMIRQH